MFGRRSRRQRARRTRRATLLRLVPLLAVTTLVAALLVGVTYTQLRTDDTAGTPAEVEKREFVATPRAEREPYTPADASAVAVADSSVATIQQGTVVAELAPHDLPGFELLGVTWTGGVPVDVSEVQVRWQQDGQWSDWTILDPGAEPGEGGIPGTEPKWVGPSTAAQARIVASEDIDPAGLTLVTVAPGESPTLTQAAASQPSIILRAQWGARAYGGSGCGSAPANGTFQGTIVHHTAGSNNYTAAQSAGIVRAAQAYHMDGQKWCDIGYNFLVDRYGQIFEGRAGGITKTPYGAHAGNSAVNASTTGVSLMGEFTSVAPTEAMKNAVVQLVAWRHSLFNVPAKGGYSIGGVNIQRIDGHRSVKATACPGQQVFNWLPTMRDQVQSAMGSYQVYGAIGMHWNARGGASGPVGAPTSPQVAVGDGALQRFQNMDLWWTAQRGVIEVRGTIRTEFRAVGETSSGLGWPLGPEYTVAGGAYQDFQGGRIFAFPSTGTFAIAAPMYAAHEKVGNVGGELGWPTSRATRLGTGSVQRFQNGSVYSPDNVAAVAIGGSVEDLYESKGGPTGLGWPTSEVVKDDVGTHVAFERGWIQTSASGTVAVAGLIGRMYVQSGAVDGPLGVPTGPERAVGTGFVQDFQGGQIQVWPEAAVIVPKNVAAVQQELGGPTGLLGWPRTGAVPTGGDGVRQTFQSGFVYGSSPTGEAYALRGGVLTLFNRFGGEAVLGRPVSAETLTKTVHRQEFQNGAVYLPLDGTPGSSVTGPIWTLYKSSGADGNANLGHPTGLPTSIGGSTRQVFSAATFYDRPAGTFVVRGYLRTLYKSFGGDTGRMGLPTESERTVGAGAVQKFDGGTLWVSPAGATATWGAIQSEYLRRGGPTGSLGWPVGPEVAGNGQWSQKFEKGTLVLTSSGAFSVR